MTPFLSRILADYESLREYEEGQFFKPNVSVSQVLRRLIAIERSENPKLPDSYYEGYSQMLFDEDVSKNMAGLMVLLPCKWANKFLMRQQGLTYVRSEYFKEWMSLVVRVPPLWILAAHRLDEFNPDCLKSCPETLRMIQKMNLLQFEHSAQPVPYIPDLHYFVEKEAGLDDLHIHLNGSTETDIVWSYMLRYPHRAVRNYSKAYHSKETVKKLSEQVMPGVTPQKLLERLSHAKKMREKMMVVASSAIGISGLPKQIERSSLISEWMLYLLVMKVIQRDSNMLLAGMLHHYLLIKGMVHRFLVMQMSQVGFSQFQIITNNTFRDDVEQHFENRFKQLAGCSDIPFLRVIEGRFSPRESSLENRLYVARIVDGFEKAKKTCPHLLQNAELRLVAHFIKKGDIRQGIRQSVLREELKRKAWALHAFVNRDTQHYGKYICGIDAAASEFDARPEVFAAAYRFLRSKGFKHFTFHAGEDFYHLLSGLRTIYEAIVHLNLQAGDRLGHCTAVGILPGLWKRRVGRICYIPSGEWLDDLVFSWAMISESQSEQLQATILKLESEISTLSMRIYGCVKHPFELWDSLLMRRWCPIPQLNEYQINALDTPLALRAKLIEELKEHIGFPLWLAYFQVDDQLMPLRKSIIREQYDKPMEVNTNSLFSDSDLEELQRIILRMMAKRNIVIEALPTSNMRISYYEKLKEYHLKRWLNINEECIMPSIVLGTDDPGIFMTNIYNEYAMVYQHLDDHEFSPMKRVEVISNLQEFSKIYRF